MIEITIADKYSLALYKISKEKNETKKILEEFKDFCKYFNDNIILLKIFKSKKIKNEEKKLIINDILCKQKISKILSNFIFIIFENKREEYIQNIYKSYLYRYQRDNNMKTGYLKIANEINHEEKKILEKKFSNIFKCQFFLNIKIEKKLIGGAILEVDGKSYEDNIEFRINCFEKHIEG